MAKDDNTMLYLGAGLLLYLYLRNKQPQPPPITAGPRLENQPPIRFAAYRVGDTVLVDNNNGLPPAPPGTQWYTQPTGAQAQQVVYTLEPLGTVHAGFDPREIM